INDSLSASERSQLGITVPIKGVPVSINSEKAKRLARQFHQQVKVTWDQTTRINMVSQTLSENAVAAYRACIDGQHRAGVRALAHNATPGNVTVSIGWFAPYGAPTTTSAEFMFNGGSPMELLLSVWKNADRRSLEFLRERGRDFRLSVNIG